MDIKLGLATPTTLWDMSLPEKQAALAQIYDAGFDHVFMADHVSFRNGSGTDGFVEVAALSQLHPQIGVMISIYLLPLRHPLPVARQLATVARIAPGRMWFGVGIGGEDRHEIEVCGIDPRTRGKRTNEALEIIRGLMDGETVDFQGSQLQVSGARIRPVPKTPIPIIVGGRSDAALVRAGRYADGWVGVWCSTRRYAEAVELVAATAAEYGRKVPRWRHGYQPWIGVADDVDTARTAVGDAMEAFYKVPFEKFERYTPFGSPAVVAANLADYAAAGARFFNLKVCTPDPQDEIEAGAAVTAELRRLLA
ncbi:MAG: LLM class flavin-dependent oxidoreductase [Pseudomonadota bacterium]